MRNLLLTLTLAFAVSGCTQVIVSGDAQLVPSTTICTKIKEKRIFYLLWGLVPITSNNLDNEIPKGSKVRVETKFTFIDILIGAVLGNFSVASQTAEIYICQ